MEHISAITINLTVLTHLQKETQRSLKLGNKSQMDHLMDLLKSINIVGNEPLKINEKSTIEKRPTSSVLEWVVR